MRDWLPKQNRDEHYEPLPEMLSPQARFSRRSRQPAYNCRCNYIYKGAHVLATMVLLQARLTAPHNFRAFAAKMPARLNSRTLPESWLKLTSSRPLQGGASHWCSQTCSWTCITTGIQAHQGSSFRKAPRRVPRGMEDVHQNDEGMLMWANSNHVDECVTLTSSHSSCLRTAGSRTDSCRRRGSGISIHQGRRLVSSLGVSQDGLASKTASP